MVEFDRKQMGSSPVLSVPEDVPELPADMDVPMGDSFMLELPADTDVPMGGSLKSLPNSFVEDGPNSTTNAGSTLDVKQSVVGHLAYTRILCSITHHLYRTSGKM